MSGCSNGQVNFFVLDTAESWQRYELQAGVAISDSGISLQRSTEYAIAQVVQPNQFPAGLNVVSIAAGGCGMLYLLDSAAHAIWIYDPNQSLFSRVPAVQGLLTAPVSIAYQDGTLFVADTAAVRLFSLALLTGQIRWTAGADVTSADGSIKVSGFTPVSLVAGPGQHLYALDSVNSTVLHFDERGQLVERLDVPPQGSNLTDLARARDGTLYVLVGTQKVLSQRAAGSFTDFLPAPASPGMAQPELDAASLAVDSYGVIYIGEPSTGGAPAGPLDSGGLPASVIWRYDPSGRSLGSLPAYSGPADLLAIDCADTLYAFSQGPTLSLLQSGATYVIPPNTPPPKAEYDSKAFDSGSTGTVWHRLVIDADLPANTLLTVHFLASDQPDANNNPNWQGPLVNVSDALLMITSANAPPANVTGQYLWLKFTLLGTENATPQVHSVRVYFPRVSYLRYLPAIYSQDPVSRGFLERFLSIFESIFSGIESTATNIVRYFDPRVVNSTFLQWLAGWLAITIDDTWSDDQVRTLLLEAPDLFRERGTPAEIAEVIRIYLGISPFIVEQLQLACAQDSEIQQVYTNLYGGGPYCFCVLVPPYQQLGTAVQGNTPPYPDADKTAFTSGDSVELVLGAHTYEIPLSGRNTLNGVRDAINELALGVVAEVRSGMARVSYQLDSSGKWTGPGDLQLPQIAAAGSGTGQSPASYCLILRARRIGPRDLQLRATAGDAGSNLLNSTDPGAYTVVSPWTQENRDALQRILDQEKPAHTCGGIQVLQPRILLDMHSYLEVNSWLVKPSPMLDTGASMPLDSVVDDSTWVGQAGVHSRVGMDIVLG